MVMGKKSPKYLLLAAGLSCVTTEGERNSLGRYKIVLLFSSLGLYSFLTSLTNIV